jgi:hypothetical protein
MLLELIPSIASHWFFATPSVLFDAGAAGCGRHRSLWSEEDFRGRGFRLVHPRGTDWPDLGFVMILAYLGGWDLATVPAVEVA